MRHEWIPGEGATLVLHRDSHAYTVVKATAKTVTLQRDRAKLLNGPKSGEPDALVVHVGGFSANVQGTQRWAYEPDPGGQTVVARLTKRGWVSHGSRVVAGRHEHYDFNF